MRAVNLIPSEQRAGGAVGARSEGAVFPCSGCSPAWRCSRCCTGAASHQLESRQRRSRDAGRPGASRSQAQAAQLAPYAWFMPLREQRLSSIAQLIGGRFDWSNAMGELSRVLPSERLAELAAGHGRLGDGDSLAERRGRRSCRRLHGVRRLPPPPRPR